VGWHFQRDAAEKAVRYIRGVLGVANHIEVVPAPSAADVRRRIAAALHRRADLDSRHIDVLVAGSVATLAGRVSSWAQRLAAENAAADAAGIGRVDNRLEVGEP
jgi:osmotically-inducible protein OsmY